MWFEMIKRGFLFTDCRYRLWNQWNVYLREREKIIKNIYSLVIKAKSKFVGGRTHIMN